jgi:transcriptional regulator GlxA family with amidase domain
VLSVAADLYAGRAAAIASENRFAIEAGFKNIYRGTSVDWQSHASALTCGGLVAAKHLGGIS